MDNKKITISVGLSLPITMLVGYITYRIGNVVGKYEAYRDVATKEFNNEDSEK